MKKILFLLLVISTQLKGQYNLYYGSSKSKYNCDSVLNCLSGNNTLFNNDIGFIGGAYGTGAPLVRNTFTDQSGFFRTWNNGSWGIGMNIPIVNYRLGVKGNIGGINVQVEGNSQLIGIVSRVKATLGASTAICYDAVGEVGATKFSTTTGFNNAVYNSSSLINKGFNYFIGSGGSATKSIGLDVYNNNANLSSDNWGARVALYNTGGATVGYHATVSNTSTSSTCADFMTQSGGSISYGVYHLHYGNSVNKIHNVVAFSGTGNLNVLGNQVSYTDNYSASGYTNFWADATRNNTIKNNYGFKMNNHKGGNNIWGAYFRNDSCELAFRGMYIINQNRKISSTDIGIEIDQSLAVSNKKAIKIHNNSGDIDFGNNNINTVNNINYTGTLTNISDVRAKENLVKIENSLEMLKQISTEIYTYNLSPEFVINTRYPEYGTIYEKTDTANWMSIDSIYINYLNKTKARDEAIVQNVKKATEKVQVGTIAQKVAENNALNSTVVNQLELNGVKYLGLDYTKFIPYLIGAIGELSTKIDAINEQLNR